MPLLERHGWRPQKKLGQHFLCSEKVVRAVCDRVQGAAGILEIGPGPGALTAPLSQQAQKLIAWELDPIAVSALTETAPQAEVHFGDVLLADLRADLARLPEPRALVSNMPYNITGPLLGKIAEVRDLFTRAVLMMQLEVGSRILAQAGDSHAGALSILMQDPFEISKVIRVPPGAFYPPPKVESIVLELIPRPASASAASDLFPRLVRSGFSQPRKTLANNLRDWIAPDQLHPLLVELGLSPQVRPHELGLDSWRKLHEKLHGPHA
ncbi:MAG TPA: 16S rRNA (adenine(1518)-N(6)/adenine(1519)-N(6))-dimethyltransferase RsmA [Fimbriimonadaceae bacterium]|nr:16S rRNA (adenine(1518)-N(6)/adenine(1519)-N(6))-dimethyltransferase RsmA [Fimbriimonadaceae bacterium]HRJ32197.1 16S rRNA (adenine(1518)-N(6)/adenine(1519)-N(6))-dimethyltransferase RsmA [Fimbriimonadaceae bacterium]